MMKGKAEFCAFLVWLTYTEAFQVMTEPEEVGDSTYFTSGSSYTLTQLWPTGRELADLNVTVENYRSIADRYAFLMRHFIWGKQLTKEDIYHGLMVKTMSGAAVTFEYKHVDDIVIVTEDGNRIPVEEHSREWYRFEIQGILAGPRGSISSAKSPQYLRAVDKFGLLSGLQSTPGMEKLTLLVPSDAAIFERGISPDTLDRRVCASMIFYANTVRGQVPTSTNIRQSRVTTLKGERLTVRADTNFGDWRGTGITIEAGDTRAAITETNARFGVDETIPFLRSFDDVHLINSVLPVQMDSDSDTSIFRVGSKFIDLFVDSDLLEDLEQSGSRYTLFVPNDAALERNNITPESLTRDERDRLIKTHVVMRTMFMDDVFSFSNQPFTFRDMATVTAEARNVLIFTKCDDFGISINSRGKEATVIESDIGEGEIHPRVFAVVHVIDEVLMGSSIRASAALSVAISLLVVAVS
mmetsp:Transcript_11070/g.26238  ORF Transcript_11070/g.26238 Transcript_11070/m.26238 type:complete len:468 (+) Transcript_11070:88-1491(+)